MLLIGIGVWLLVVILILMFFRGASEKEVTLRPLDMQKSKIDTNLFDEMRKCYEEDLDNHIKKMYERGYVFKE